MRRAARTDSNQTAIVSALRSIGASVAVTSAVGDGFPDIVVGYRGSNYLIEIKDGGKPPSAQALTDDQIMFHGSWCGVVYVVNSIEQALTVVKRATE